MSHLSIENERQSFSPHRNEDAPSRWTARLPMHNALPTASNSHQHLSPMTTIPYCRAKIFPHQSVLLAYCSLSHHHTTPPYDAHRDYERKRFSYHQCLHNLAHSFQRISLQHLPSFECQVPPTQPFASAESVYWQAHSAPYDDLLHPLA